MKNLQPSFTGGEISESLQNRIDLQKFTTWLKQAKNTIIHPQGGISNRPGTLLVYPAKTFQFKIFFTITDSSTEMALDAVIKIDGVIVDTGSSVTVSLDANEEYAYEISAEGYVTQSGTINLTSNTSLNIALIPTSDEYTFTISPTPVDATVMINEVEQSNITAISGTQITWSVSKDGYTTQSGSLILSKTSTLNVTLTQTVTLTVEPSPSDATVIINGTEQTSLILNIGDSYTYSVSKTGYVTVNGSGTITEDTTLQIALSLSVVEISNIINPRNEDSKVETIYEYTVTGDAIFEITLYGQGGGDYYYPSYNYANGAGGKIAIEKTFSNGDVFKIKRIDSGRWLNNIYAGCGIGLWLNDVCIMVAGGGGTSGIGGGGYLGGFGVYNVSLQNNGLSYDGTDTSGNTDYGSGAIGGKGQTNGYGGTGYILPELTEYLTLYEYGSNYGESGSGNAAAGYAKIEYKG
jgi:phosphotransferase system HPr-like phosphotransfer protein